MRISRPHCQVGTGIVHSCCKSSCNNVCSAVIRALTCQADYTRQKLDTADGGTVALDWFAASKAAQLSPNAPVVLVLHGLTGKLTNTQRHSTFACIAC